MSLPPFEQVVREHGPVVRRVCRAVLGPVDADDAWSETFLSAMRAYPDLPDGSNVLGWLVTIAHRRSLDEIRRVGRRPRPIAEPPERVADAVVEPDDELERALRELPRGQREAVTYHYLAGLPHREVGLLLDCSEDAARRRCADGIARLRAVYTASTPTRKEHAS